MLYHSALFARILAAVDDDAYLTPTEHVDPHNKPALDEVRRLMRARDVDPAAIKRRILELHETGRLDRVHTLSALHVLAASPAVKDYAEAARLAGEQEQAALEAGGPWREANLASVDRHRGLRTGRRARGARPGGGGGFWGAPPGGPLDHFTRALERQRSPENIGNVLATLLALGELEEAEAIHASVCRTLAAEPLAQLQRQIADDPDLALLRAVEAP